MRTLKVSIAGRRYEIPEMWLVGATRSMAYAQAIQHWHEQAEAEQASEATREEGDWDLILRGTKQYELDAGFWAPHPIIPDRRD